MFGKRHELIRPRSGQIAVVFLIKPTRVWGNNVSLKCVYIVIQSIIMKKFICVAAVVPLIFLYSCSSTNLVFISVKEPAPVTLPDYVKSVAVINRTTPSEKTRALNKVHEVLSMESDNLVREGSTACINGLTDELMNNNRFTNIVKVDSTDISSFGAGVFPAPLDWDKVEDICRETNTDAVFSLELFDTESKINYTANKTSINTALGNIPALEHHVSMNTLVKTGWRMYDLSSHTILDESYISKDMNFSGNGINPVAAAQAIIGKKEAVKQAGNAAGHLYANKIDPYWIRVHREYFVRGKSGSFGVAKRKAQTGNWNDAANIWMEQTKSSNRKTAGRACYNMAIINEINGNIDAAMSWAQKAYENYRIRLGLDYVNILRHRKADEELLTAQNAN